MVLRVNSHKYDDKQLGRWASQTFLGKNEIITRMFSVYVPIITSKHRLKKVICQQQNTLLKMGISEQVIKIFWGGF